ncbi:MAG: redoxin domain-containing protein [Proteobacteria bacterium]|nr:redoxin domain-containing protein [Pseudomonadota bacterium]
MEALQAIYSDVQALGGDIVVLSGEKPDISKALAAKHKLAFPIVHDDKLAIARSFGLVFTLPDDLKAVYQSFGIDLPKNTGNPGWELPVPSRFVADRTGTIRSVEADPDYTVRPEPSATLAVLRSLAP